MRGDGEVLLEHEPSSLLWCIDIQPQPVVRSYALMIPSRFQATPTGTAAEDGTMNKRPDRRPSQTPKSLVLVLMSHLSCIRTVGVY